MASVKMAMVSLYCWSTFLDIYLSLLATPFQFYPAMAGFPAGLLNVFRVPSSIQVYVGVSLIAVTGVAILGFFENRYQCLCRVNSKTSNWKRLIYMLLNYIFSFTFFIPAYLNIPDVEIGKNYLARSLRCFNLDYLNHPKLFILSLDNTIPALCNIVAFMVIVPQCFFFILYISSYLMATKTTSPMTFKLQKTFLQAMAIQITIPLGIIGAPILYIIFASILQYYNQAINNLMMMLMSLHGFFSSTVMLIVHKPYRTALVEIYNKSVRFTFPELIGVSAVDTYQKSYGLKAHKVSSGQLGSSATYVKFASTTF